MSMRSVIVAIHSQADRDRVCGALVSLGYEVTLADSGAALLELTRTARPEHIVTDQALLAGAGDGWLSGVRDSMPDTPLVVLPKPDGTIAEVEPGGNATPTPELMLALESVLGARRRGAGNLAEAARRRPPLDPFVGKSPAIRRLAQDSLKALASESPILIEGETGTGKGVLAAWLHRQGARSHEPFVDLNCAGLSRELMDSELFGHGKGAFTGAVTSKPGLLEVADRGTLFLDEIGDMDGPIQAKLLKVIEEKRFRRVGETRERHADVRVIAATHHNLLQRVRERLFREDLYYRIGVLPLRVPTLRIRSVDVPLLARRILSRLALELARPEPELAPDAERALMAHAWPGNLRELRNELERAMLACEQGTIQLRHLQLAPGVAMRGLRTSDACTLEDVERAFIKRVLDEEGRVERAAQRLGIPRSTFYQKLRALGLTPRP